MAVRESDQRRMDIVAAPNSRAAGARRGVALFCDITVVSPLSRVGQARPSTASNDGHVLTLTATRKHRRYADINRSGVGALIVLGCEVYGRWCPEALALVSELAGLKARSVPDYLQASTRSAWLNRWWGIASVGVMNAIGESLLAGNGPDLLAGSPAQAAPAAIDLLDLHADL